MQIDSYIAYVYQGGDQNSSHQYVTQHPKEYYYERRDDLTLELWRYYYQKVFRANQLSAMTAFLDYHMFKFGGEISDFVFFVRMSPEWIPMEAVAFISNTRFRSELGITLVEWLDQKKQIPDRKPYLLDAHDFRIKPIREGELVPIEEIERFFVNRLCRPKKISGKNIVEKDQVKQWVHACFHGSELKMENIKIKVNGSQRDILSVVYEFFDKVDTDTFATDVYCYVLIDTFDKFCKYIDPETGRYKVEKLQTNFSRAGRKSKRYS